LPFASIECTPAGLLRPIDRTDNRLPTCCAPWATILCGPL